MSAFGEPVGLVKVEWHLHLNATRMRPECDQNLPFLFGSLFCNSFFFFKVGNDCGNIVRGNKPTNRTDPVLSSYWPQNSELFFFLETTLFIGKGMTERDLKRLDYSFDFVPFPKPPVSYSFPPTERSVSMATGNRPTFSIRLARF